MQEHINKYTGSNHSLNYIYRLSDAYQIKAIIRRKKPGHVKHTPEQIGENILSRNFGSEQPNQKWLSDVTEFKISTGQKLYMCAIMDLYDNSIISYELSTSNNNALVFSTFKKAIKKYPNAKPIFHSDRGYQYTSKKFKQMLDKQGMIQSMSRVGKCIDNGPIENLWGIIKTEMFYINKFDSIIKLRKAIHKYIKFYNNIRLQSKLKSHSPMEYRHMA
ncbi:transposase [Tenericutes bacterium MO-XQ]|nr:transposase [Tenericutes bacterium MO-XQ]